MSTTLRLGDTVKGLYHNVPFEGILNAFDGSGYAYIKCNITVYGVVRDGIALDPYARKTLTLVKRGNVDPEDIGHLPYTCVGGSYLRDTKAIDASAEEERAMREDAGA